MPRPNAAFALCATIAAVTLSGCGPGDTPATGRQGGPPPTLEVRAVAGSGKKAEEVQPKWTRAEFESLVTGKAEAEVLAEVGKPGKTGGSADMTYWAYYEVTRDPVADKVDWYVVVWFKGGRVSMVSY